MIFTEQAKEDFARAYPAEPVKLSHTLSADDFFSLDRLADLAGALPPELVEYNRGDLPVDQDPDKTPGNGLSPAETVRSIEENGSWLVMKNVERDAACHAKMMDALVDLQHEISRATGPMFRHEAFIFISSPDSVTPFHMDPEHNILMQIRGTKQMRVYDAASAGILSPELHEAYHAGGHRNLPFEAHYDDAATRFELEPGDAVHVPVKAPHWVQNGPGVSISFSITWRSRLSVREADLHRMNAWLRARGLSPAPTGSGLRDSIKVSAFRALHRAGIIPG